MKILLIEDEHRIAKALAEVLIDQNYLVDIASDGQIGWEFTKAFPYDLIVLDLMLPKLDGITLCRQLRQEGYSIPILLLTAKDTSTDKVIGLDAGADDYVVKPFDLQELMARIRALLRRGTTIVYHFLSYNLYQKLDGEIINLANAASHNLIAAPVEKKAINTRIPRILDNDDDGDLDIPWQDLRENHQGVEWFDANGKLLAKAGTTISRIPFIANFDITQHNKIRSITIPVYLHSSSISKKLQGYVRVSESTEELEEELDRLLWGFELGGLIVIILSGLGGWWLTRQSLQPIEQSIQQLKQFTADASHELRSPLTIIKTSVEVIMNYPDRIHPANLNKLEAISSASNQMTQLVEDLLLLARTDAVTNNQVIAWISIPIDELLEDLVDFWEQEAVSKEIILKSEISTEVFIKGEAIQLKRLLSNLLQNALHYTPKGGTVIISLVKLERLIAINIQDTGIGIAPEHIPLIFNRFWRADQARSQREGGLGLGLAIADAIARTHGGDITVTSEVGVGSCFQVRLPLVS